MDSPDPANTAPAFDSIPVITNNGGLSFSPKAIIQSPLFWMAVGAGVLYFIQHKSKSRPVAVQSKPIIDV